ncbi:peptidyl-prolyl cis-trans isomerase [Hahella sp. KA22]|uniref:peptidylprolyl isomerase n=1 Tax=Hahella sp. KA22 TaxID=1628392 RepID=UPI000FDECF6C|nr:peptidylprolyl isomerase [Hahella sp. KA22]AZZ91375.1 peptidyl-prolyl cis-trans isomerase [Hahella sp. KA22]QAY54745.1 peptidyl-prolyl cis-trans isomerase [Hahella sp. KA22]
MRHSVNAGKRGLLGLAFWAISLTAMAADLPTATISTSEGDIKIKLFSDKAPVTVENFVSYIKDGYYDGLIFHRTIPQFMIQGGGFKPNMEKKDTKAPIKNESDNGLANDRGTLAMARTNDPNSATSQFFINVIDNAYLNGAKGRPGYAVFGEVVSGMDVVDKIANTPTQNTGPYQNVPVKTVTINSIKLDEVASQQ